MKELSSTGLYIRLFVFLSIPAYVSRLKLDGQRPSELMNLTGHSSGTECTQLLPLAVCAHATSETLTPSLLFWRVIQLARMLNCRAPKRYTRLTRLHLPYVGS